MKNINPKLSKEIFIKAGFMLAGDYWIKSGFAEKFMVTSKPNEYKLIIGELDLSKSYPIISNYSEFLQVMVRGTNLYIQKKVKSEGLTPNNPNFIKRLSEIISDIFKFDENFNLVLRMDPSLGGIGITPYDYYTFSLLNGYIAEFKVVYNKINSEGILEEEFEICPPCVSSEYIKSEIVKEDCDIQMVYIKSPETKIWEKFFGISIRLQ